MKEAVKLYTSKDDIKNLPLGTIRTTVMAGNGTFELRKSWLGKSQKKVNNYEMVIYPNLEETVELTNERDMTKVPKEAIMYVIEWYKRTTERTGDEAQINFYHNTRDLEKIDVDDKEIELKSIKGIKFWNDKVFSYTPVQKNTGAHTSADDPIYDALNAQVGLYVETHSHNSMGAFASGEDLSNSKNDAIQLVFGKLNTDNIEMHTWATVREVTLETLLEEEVGLYIDLPEHTINDKGKYVFDKDMINDFNYDDTLIDGWDKQVKVIKRTTPKYYTAKTNTTKYTQGSLFDDYYGGYSYGNYYGGYGNADSIEGLAIEAAYEQLKESRIYAEIPEDTLRGLIELYAAGMQSRWTYDKDKIVDNITSAIDDFFSM